MFGYRVALAVILVGILLALNTFLMEEASDLTMAFMVVLVFFLVALLSVRPKEDKKDQSDTSSKNK